MDTRYKPQLGTPPPGLLEGKRKAQGKRNGTHVAFALALDNPTQWVRAFVYDYEPNLESQKRAYNASRARIKLLRECGESFAKQVQAVDEHNTEDMTYIVWVRVIGDLPAKKEETA